MKAKIEGRRDGLINITTEDGTPICNAFREDVAAQIVESFNGSLALQEDHAELIRAAADLLNLCKCDSTFAQRTPCKRLEAILPDVTNAMSIKFSDGGARQSIADDPKRIIHRVKQACMYDDNTLQCGGVIVDGDRAQVVLYEDYRCEKRFVARIFGTPEQIERLTNSF